MSDGSKNQNTAPIQNDTRDFIYLSDTKICAKVLLIKNEYDRIFDGITGGGANEQ